MGKKSPVGYWLIVLLAKKKLDFKKIMRLVRVIQNMMLTFWSNGYGTKWTTGPVTRYPDFPDIVGFDSNEEVVVGLLWAGLPNTIPEKRARDSSRNVTWLP